MERTIIIGTRGSELALWQANHTKSLLEEIGIKTEIKVIQTSGDRSQDWNTSFEKLEGKGFFTKELEEALLAKTIDLAVHSYKDLPTEGPEGLLVAAVSRREDPSELIIVRKDAADDKLKFGLKKNARVGTSSSRRKSQLLAFRPDVEVQDLRGNVPTRIRKLREGNYDAIMLAAAGVERLEIDLEEFHVERPLPEEFVPAPAQGVLAWQTRDNDDWLMEQLEAVNDIDVMVKCGLERRVLNLFDGGCQLPLGVYCTAEAGDDERQKWRLFISMAKAWNEQPVQVCYEAFDTDDFAEQSVDRLRSITPKKIFITRNSKPGEYFSDSLNRLGFTTESKSLIEFKAIRIKELPKTDWIFFSSKHAVKYFFIQKPEVGNVKFGCIGTGTSAELRAHGHRADFIGQSTDTKLVGKQFSSKVGNGKVLFPIARGSMQSIQWQMVKRENVFNLEVYATLKHSIEVSDDFNILVFTSPSNVEAFFEKNRIHPSQRVIAMGEATGKALEKEKCRNYTLPVSFDDLGLLRAVLGVTA